MFGTALRSPGPRSSFLSLLLCIAFDCAVAGRAASEIFVESFSSLEHCDVENTTARWDTAAGELRLHPYPISPEAGINTHKAAYSFARSGDYVFLGIGDVGIHVLDISDIHKMKYVGEYLWIEFPNEMCVDGDRLYVAAYDRFIVLDISDPTNPILLGESNEMYQINDVVVAGETAYLSSCSEGFYSVDVGDPSAPVLLGHLDTPSCAQSLTVHGDHAYVCTGYLGFSVIDISDPALPRHVGQVPASYHPERIHVAGGLAYVAETSGELLIYSLIDPATPVLLGACELPGNALDVKTTGNLAYVTIGDSDTTGFCSVDVSDPAQPRVVSSSGVPRCPIQVELFGEFALVNALSHFLAVRIADPVPPTDAGFLPEPSFFEFIVDGSLAYAIAWQAAGRFFHTVSLADPEQPLDLGSCELDTYPMSLAQAGPYVYLSAFSDGLLVMDVRDPAHPQAACSAHLDRTGVSVLPYGDRLFLGYVDHGTGIMTLDISDPIDPVPLNELALQYSPREMCRSGDYIFVLQWEEGGLREVPGSRQAGEPRRVPRRDDRRSDILVLDISDPAAPVPAATFSVSDAYVEHLYVDGDLLYGCFWTFENWHGNGFVVFDVSDPLNPQPLGRWEDGDGLGQLVLSGDLAYQAGGPRIDVLDVGNPASPVHLHTLATQRSNNWLGVGGDYLFATGGYGGMRSIRISDRSADIFKNVAQSPALPATETPLSRVRMKSAQTPTLVWEFSADDGEHWKALPGPDEWLVLDFPGSEPRWRATLLYTEIGEPPVVDELDLEWICAPTAVPDAAPPAVFALHPAAPNPFNPSTTIRFDLPRACPVRVDIFDVAGRLRRRLVDSDLPAGRHQVSWDGRDNAGVLLGSGIYGCRMRAGGFERSRKLALTR
ncbi:MAG: FlgD immunoglobulin-like domain containing protein [Candidatus Eisenbacteria bacterium]